MCNCIEKLHEDLKPKIQEKFSKPNKPVHYFAISQTIGGRAVIDVKIYLKEQVKSVSSFVIADFCPWCGVKYSKAD